MELKIITTSSISGQLDAETRKMMAMKRCGNRDVDDMQSFTRRRKRRYLLHGGMWSKGELSWRISTYTPDMSREDVDKEVKRAFQVSSEGQMNGGGLPTFFSHFNIVISSSVVNVSCS